MRARSYRLIWVLTAVIVACIAFSGGFFLRGQSGFLASLGFPESITGISSSSTTDASAGNKDAFNSVSARVAEVEDLLNSRSLDEFNLDTATAGALNAFGEASGDPYVRFYTKERLSELMNRDEGTYAGIGVLFSDYNGKAYATEVFEGSPAWERGVREGDFVVSIELKTDDAGSDEEGGEEGGEQGGEQGGEAEEQKADESASQSAASATTAAAASGEADSDEAADGAVSIANRTWSRNDVTALLSQSEGKEVYITWRRPESLEADGGDEYTTQLTCMKFDVENVTSSYDRSLRVGYIKVRQLAQNTAQNVEKALDDLSDRGAGAFVLDLRDNPGGYLSQAVDLASLFISSGNIALVRTIDGDMPKPASGKVASSNPLVVIVNKNTASAAEVVVAALKETGRATEIVGETTLGKGSVQVLDELTFGGAMQYTAAYYLTPEGHSINNVGVTPTYPLSATGDGSNQRRTAMRLAGNTIASGDEQPAEEH